MLPMTTPSFSLPSRGIRKHPRFIGTLLFSLIALSQNLCYGADISVDANLDPVEALIQTEMQHRHIPGIAVAIIEEGEFASVWTLGLADLENQIPVTRDTMFRFASVSKPISAVAVMKCVEDGRLNPDTSLVTLGLSVPPHLAKITIRQLLSHQSGLRHYQGNAETQPLHHFTNLADAVKAKAADPLLFEPGTRFGYSTYGYLVLGHAVEMATGTPFMNQLSNSVFQTAQMKHARADHLYELIPHRAQGYFRSLNGQLRNSQPADLSGKIPGGGLIGTIDDLAAFAIALLNNKLLTPQTRGMMWTKQGLSDGTKTDYGLGWHLGTKADRREVYHSGSQARTSSFLYLRPEEQIAIAVLSNLEQVNYLPLVRSIADLVDHER